MKRLKHISSSRRTPGSFANIMKQIPAFAGMTMMLTFAAAPAFADNYLFSPPGCEFAMEFPEAPTTAKRCNPMMPDQCTDSSVFLRMYAMNSSLRVIVTCTPAEPDMMQRYSGDVMRYTLETMAKDNAKEYETGFNDFGTAKQAVLLGNSQKENGEEDVYMAQLWIGKTSVLTVEGFLKGMESDDSDQTFTAIMKSIQQAPPPPVAKDEDAEDEEESDKKDE